MSKSLLCLAALAAACVSAQAADAPAVATNLSLTTNYKYRGQDQGNNKPAVQGGFDYAHSSGFYVGNWNSSITSSSSADGGGIEMDFYGGYKGEFSKGFGYDVGFLRYQYPNIAEANTNELYGALSYGPVVSKLSYVVSKGYFGKTDARGTIYGDVSLNQPLTKTLTLNAHVGATVFTSDAKSAGAAAVPSVYVANYLDYKLGVTYDLGAGFSAAAAVVGATKTGATEYGVGNKARLIATITKAM